MRKIILALAIAAMTVSAFAIGITDLKKSSMKQKILNCDPDNRLITESKMPYSGLISTAFDKAGHGNGWIYGYNRKVQWNLDPITGSMVGSIYRQLHATGGLGTIGAMVGTWGTGGLSSLTTTLYSSSYWWSAPGGRYPFSAEFINGYFFTQYNDYDYEGSGATTDSWGMYAVADATWGYDWTTWEPPKRLEATEGGATIPGAWTGTGDVVYDPVSGYYYWTQSFGEGGLDGGIDGGINSTCVGRSTTPAVLNSWVWTDYNDLRFDGAVDTEGVTAINEFHVAYCKDIYGNGTGYGIAMAVCNQVDDEIMLPDSSNYVQNAKLSWMYTTNWGADDSSGDWKPNWIHNGPDKLFRLEMKDIFDWYGEPSTTRDSIGLDEFGNIIWDTTEVMLMDDPFITWNISNVATENNIVHVFFEAFPASTSNPGYFYSATDSNIWAGRYYIKGTITEAGVTWSKAKFVASLVDMEKGFDLIEFTASNRNWMSIGYAGLYEGREVIYAQWQDKPTSRAVANTFPEPEMIYYIDSYLTTSTDGGWNWDMLTPLEFETGDETYPIWTQTYGTNITKTSTLHEQGFVMANHGTVDSSGFITTYGAHQYYDPANPTEPVADVNDHQQFLHIWKITGTTNGIETESVSLEKDFALYQNYPNPFNPSTAIRFSIEKDSDVKLSVYNTKGELVASLKEGKMAKGAHSVNFDATALNSGVYFCKLTVNGATQAKKMVLTK